MKKLLFAGIVVVLPFLIVPAQAAPTLGHCLKRANQMQPRERTVQRSFCFMIHSGNRGK